MEFVRLVLVFLHLLGMALLLGGFLLLLKEGTRARVDAGWLHGALLQLVTGLALVGVNEAEDRDLDHVKVAVKLLVMLVILGLVVFGRRRGKDGGAPDAWVLPALVGLVVLNVGVAVFWT